MSEAVVELRGISKSFGSKKVLSGITAAAKPGDIIGVLGRNGAGKTTLLEVLLGFSPPDAGRAEIFGEESLEMPESIKARIGFAPQQDELMTVFSGSQQLKITRAFHRNWDNELVERLLTEWDVPLDRRIGTMSVGERQKLSLLLALGHHPALLVLDEPVASLDPIARRNFVRRIVDVSDDPQRVVLFSSHIVTDLERAANKVWILKDGDLAWQGGVDELKESVVRLHVRGKRALPSDLGLPHTLACRVDGHRAIVSVTAWNPAERVPLAAKLDAEVEVEALGLEDIFLEMHQ